MSYYMMISKDNCPYCVKAKALFKTYGVPVDVLNVPDDLSRDEFISTFEGMDQPLTVPQVYAGNKVIGGYGELLDYFRELGER